MRLIDLYPTRGAFAPGEPIELAAEIETPAPASAAIRLSVFHLASLIDERTIPVALGAGRQRIALDWQPPPIAPRGYGADVELIVADQASATASTAFDVLNHWTQAPRYGFLCDFTPGRNNAPETLDELARFHINGVQFYDWQYRHDQPLSPSDEFTDPLGRRLSLATVRTLIESAHRRAVAAMPYTAVYAASPEFHRAHPDWGLYHVDGRPLQFADGFLFYMNPTPDSRWSRRLLDQYTALLRALDFDGIHIDQYGDPIAARDAAGRVVQLDRAFPAFVDSVVERIKPLHPHASVVFNCVGNWPVETVARSRVDFMYIEVWKPHTQWRDLWRLITDAQRMSGKPVVLAAYIDPARELNVRLADAIIFASGGGHMELGERDGLLADPYFPKYGLLSDRLRATLRAYYDFAVRYEDVLALATRDVTDEWAERVTIDGVPIGLQHAHDAVWPIVREGAGFTAISLINLAGLAGGDWTEALSGAPLALESIVVRLRADRPIQTAWFASPDGDSPRAQPVDLQKRGGEVVVEVPGLHWWALLVLKWE